MSGEFSPLSPQRDVVYLGGHNGDVSRIVELPDSDLIATSGDDGIVRVFNRTSGKLCRSLSGHSGRVAGLLALGGDLLVSGGRTDCMLRLWNVRTGDCCALQLGGGVRAIEALADGRLVTCADTHLVFVDRSAGLELRETHRIRNAHDGPIRDMSVSGHCFATASVDKTAKVWDAMRGKHLGTLSGHIGELFCVDMTETFIATGSRSSSIRLYSTKSLMFVLALDSLHAGSVRSLCLAGNGWIVSFARDKTIKYSHIATEETVATVHVEVALRNGICLSDGRLAVCGLPNYASIFSSPLAAGHRFPTKPVEAVIEQTVFSLPLAHELQEAANEIHDSPSALAIGYPILDDWMDTTEGGQPSSPVRELQLRVERTLRRHSIHEGETPAPACGNDSVVCSYPDRRNANITSVEEWADEKILTQLDRRVRKWMKILQSSSKATEEKLVAAKEVQCHLIGWWVDRSRLSISAGPSETGAIGTGGFGTVYRGTLRNGSTTVEVAIKELDDSVARPDLKVKFFREIVLQNELDHPNIVKFRGAWWPEDSMATERDSRSATFRMGQRTRSPLIVSELMDGNLLTAQKNGLLPDFKTKVRVLTAVAEALEFLHNKRVLHQDISPENVLVGLRDEKIVEVKVSDFGLSRILRNSVSSSRSETCAGRDGKVAYMAPERLLESSPPDLRGDVWSFGVVCCFVARGRISWGGLGQFALYKAAENGALVEHCRNWAGGIANDSLRRITLGCLAPEPRSRLYMGKVLSCLKNLLSSL